MEGERATAGRMIDRLVANGWVERRTQPDDRRVKRVYLTKEAERVHKRIWRVAEDTVDAAMGDLAGPERKQLMTLLQRVKATLVSADEDQGVVTKGAATASDRRRTSIANGRLNGRAAP